MGDKLGLYSYAIYLCHVPIIRTLYATWNTGFAELFWTAAALSLVFAALLGEVDVRLYRVCKSVIDRISSRSRWIFAVAFSLAFLYFAWLGIRLAS